MANLLKPSLGKRKSLYGGDPVAVCRELGQLPAWVARRARVHSNLADKWREAILEPDSSFWSWTLQHLEEVANLGTTEQRELLERLLDNRHLLRSHLALSELRNLIAESTLRLDCTHGSKGLTGPGSVRLFEPR